MLNSLVKPEMGKLAGRGMPSRLGKERRRLVSSSDPERGHRSTNWLNTAAWRRLREKVLLRDEYICQQTGVALVGRHPAPNSPVVDHKIPHRGDAKLFWDEGNLQSVSKAWHDSEKQSREKRGLV